MLSICSVLLTAACSATVDDVVSLHDYNCKLDHTVELDSHCRPRLIDSQTADCQHSSTVVYCEDSTVENGAN